MTLGDFLKARLDAMAEAKRIEGNSPAKEVAGKSIGKYGLFYITLIVVIGVVSSLQLDNEKIAAVMGLLGASLTALISMLNNIAGANEKVEVKPEFEVIKDLIAKLDRLDRKEMPMRVDVEGDHVTVTKGDDVVTARK
jgi:ABC-type proline/glycine betaine transport system ATPase subunit